MGKQPAIKLIQCNLGTAKIGYAGAEIVIVEEA